MTRAAVVAAAALLAATGCSAGAPHAGGVTGAPRSGTPGPASPSAGGPVGTTPAAPHALRVQTATWRLPERVSREVAVRVPGGAVLAGGLLPGDVSTARTFRVRLPAGTTSRLAPLPTAAHDAAGALVNGRPAVLGGGAATELGAVQRLAADGAWHATGSLPGARSDLGALSYGGTAVVVGGYDGVRLPRQLLDTRDGRRFATLGTLPAGVRYAAVARIGRTAWVIGGERGGRELTTVHAVDLRSGRVRATRQLPRATGHAAAVVLGGRILLVGGRTTPDRPTAAMWWFSPANRTWRRAGRLPRPLADAPAVVAHGTAYLFGGESPDFTDRVTELTWR